MAKFVADDVKFYIGGYDLSGDHNEISLSYEAEIKDSTAMGSTARTKLPGLVNATGELNAFYEAGSGEADTVLAAVHGVADSVITISPDGGDDGEVAYTMQGIVANYVPQGSIGEIFVLKTTLEGSGLLIRGTIMGAGAKTATGNGTARQLGAVSATQKLYASLHVLAVSGTDPTLDVIICSDNAENMLDPTTKITFTQKTAIGSQWATPVAGSITDDWWQARWTITGTNTPTFTILVTVGIK